MQILPPIDRSWTLFLDRDGVINHEKNETYVLQWSEFKFYKGVTEALKTLAHLFGTIVIVTNQRGVGKGLMTTADLLVIHNNMVKMIVEEGGRIDAVYYCDSMDNDCFERKPNPGMALLAKKDFSHINFNKSMMVGNKLSDMAFGKNAGMFTVYVDTTNPEVPSPHSLIDYRFKNLPAFTSALNSVIIKT